MEENVKQSNRTNRAYVDSTTGALCTLEEQSLVAAPHTELGVAQVPDWGWLPANTLKSCEVRAGWRQQEMQTHPGRSQWSGSISVFSDHGFEGKL